MLFMVNLIVGLLCFKLCYFILKIVGSKFNQSSNEVANTAASAQTKVANINRKFSEHRQRLNR